MEYKLVIYGLGNRRNADRVTPMSNFQFGLCVCVCVFFFLFVDIADRLFDFLFSICLHLEIECNFAVSISCCVVISNESVDKEWPNGAAHSK